MKSKKERKTATAPMASGSETASTKRKKGQGIEGQMPAKKSKGEGLFIF
jgi:hypothetical protein